ncbi:choice-of-anchor P family protein [Nocardiopsis sediminis]|uniref:Choice-of-anchor P family protein n=1 Tax=Nocardiopsis sediminis TaxID=1778267 RepID=A0ABV8FWZ5_9ACTN
MGTAHAEPPPDNAPLALPEDFLAPFDCDVEWEAVTYSDHNPEPSVDFQDADIVGQNVRSSADGTVARVEDEGQESYGRWIVIDHEGDYSTLYAHLDSQSVSVGDSVGQGDIIGTAGNTGDTTGPHLHYEQQLSGEPVRVVLDGEEIPYYGRTPVTSTNCGDDGEDPDPPDPPEPPEPPEPVETTLEGAGPESVANGSPAELSAVLTDESDDPVEGRQVDFVLGSDESEQQCSGDTNAEGLASCSIEFVEQPLNDEGTVPVSAAFAGDDEYAASEDSGALPLEYVTGQAYGLSADVPLLGLPISIDPTPDTGEVRTAGEETEAPECAQSVGAILVNADVLCAEVATQTGPSGVTSTASLEEASIGLPGLPVLGISGVEATSTSSCEEQSGSVDLTLTVAGTPVEIGDAPNVDIDLGVAGTRLVVNEQVEEDGELTVNAAHLTGPGGIDVVIASSTSAAHNCA